MLDNKTVREFVEELGSKSPAPGGGSVAALSASIGAALGSMVFNLTVGKKAYKVYSDEERNEVDSSLEETSKIQHEFLDLMNKDTEEFLELMKAFKLPKESDEEKKIRSQKIQEGYVKALKVPLEVAEKAFDIYKYIEVASRLGNKNAISDAGVASLMIQAALEGAVLNVKINLGSIKDDEYKKEINLRCEQLTTEGRNKRDNILSTVNSQI